MLSHRNLLANSFHYIAFLAFRPDTRWLVAAPLFHAAGSVAVLASVWNGGRHALLPVFDPVAALDLIERHGVTDAGLCRRCWRRSARSNSGPAP